MQVFIIGGFQGIGLCHLSCQIYVHRGIHSSPYISFNDFGVCMDIPLSFLISVICIFSAFVSLGRSLSI